MPHYLVLVMLLFMCSPAILDYLDLDSKSIITRLAQVFTLKVTVCSAGKPPVGGLAARVFHDRGASVV